MSMLGSVQMMHGVIGTHELGNYKDPDYIVVSAGYDND